MDVLPQLQPTWYAAFAALGELQIAPAVAEALIWIG